jgi:hypothetical protein
MRIKGKNNEENIVKEERAKLKSQDEDGMENHNSQH